MNLHGVILKRLMGATTKPNYINSKNELKNLDNM
jgi:hypothetical protein